MRLNVRVTPKGEAILPLELLVARVEDYVRLNKNHKYTVGGIEYGGSYDAFKMWIDSSWMLELCAEYDATSASNDFDEFRKWLTQKLGVTNELWADAKSFDLEEEDNDSSNT